MNDDEKILTNRFMELSKRADNKNIYQYTQFLSLAELDVLNKTRTQLGRFEIFGGFPTAERCIACFGNSDDFGYDPSYPISCIRIAPRNEKYSDTLTHRDFLGALMSLGITRERLGDIVLDGNTAYLFCYDSISQYICDSLSEVKHTYIDCQIIDNLPDVLVKEPDTSIVNISSERIDAIIAAVYKLSRSDSQKLFTQKLVYINAKECLSPSATLDDGDVVSIRHKGRFVYCGIEKTTKKGRLVCGVKKY